MSPRPAVGDVVCVDQEMKTYRVDRIGQPGEHTVRRYLLGRSVNVDRSGKARLVPILGHAVRWVDLDRLTVMPERRMVWTDAAVSA